MLDFLAEWGYIGLFLASFLAATVLPFSSELVFAALVAAGLDIWTCVIAATVGNTLGGMTSYWVGSLGKIEWVEKYLRIKRENIEKMQRRLQGPGAVSAFFAFVPGIGDVIVVALGFMRANFWIATIFMLLGKFLRYVLVGFGTEGVLTWFQ